MEHTLQLVELRLSSNPQAKTIDSVDGINGKLNEMSDGRGYYLAVFADANDPFAQERTRVISQQFDGNGNPTWKAGSPSKVKRFVGKSIPARIVNRAVEPYELPDGNTVSTYTAVVLGTETIEQAFTRQGHSLVESTESVASPSVDVALASEA